MASSVSRKKLSRCRTPALPALPRDWMAAWRSLICFSVVRNDPSAARWASLQLGPSSPDACTAASLTWLSLWPSISAISSACRVRAPSERPTSRMADRHTAGTDELKKGARRACSPMAVRHSTAASWGSSAGSFSSAAILSACLRAASRPSTPMARVASARTSLFSSLSAYTRFAACLVTPILPRHLAAAALTSGSSSSSSLATSSA
mmetsp:Transcript_101606/g.287903  ORF Transcript_101606/g.287903 Transcript_101606/m.287903 type:complete len:207 (-) Transcript_101606:272-892(-)